MSSKRTKKAKQRTPASHHMAATPACDLQAGHPKPVEIDKKAVARGAPEGVASNTVVLLEWCAYPFENRVDVGEAQKAMRQAVERVSRGDLRDAESILAAQIISLNAIFTQLAHMSRATEFVDTLDGLLRLALKAQTQCRATAESLAAIKNPSSAVFAKQANITHGPQQVNNAFTRAETREPAPTRLLEAPGARLDFRTAFAAERRDPALETVGALDGPAHSGGEGAGGSER